jgi:hypothetical protein
MHRCVYPCGCVLLAFASGSTLLHSAEQPDLDPQALDVLKQTVSSITGAKNYSFHVLIARDRLATNGQIITYFNDDSVTVSRPDKVRIDVDGEHNNSQFY